MGAGLPAYSVLFQCGSSARPKRNASLHSGVGSLLPLMARRISWAACGKHAGFSADIGSAVRFGTNWWRYSNECELRQDGMHYVDEHSALNQSALAKSGSLGLLGPLLGTLPTRAGAILPRREDPLMKTELKEALRLINKVLINPRLGPGQQDHLLRAKRELEKASRSGKLDARKIFRAVQLIATSLQDIVENKAST